VHDGLFGKRVITLAGKGSAGPDEALPVPETALLLDAPLKGPYPEHLKNRHVWFGAASGVRAQKFCNWTGLHTAVGYRGPYPQNPHLQEVCTA